MLGGIILDKYNSSKVYVILLSSLFLSHHHAQIYCISTNIKCCIL
jgi:replicative DNA helicase